MHEAAVLTTPRLVLRQWNESDKEHFARINADPRVMEFFPAHLTRAQSDALVAKLEAHFRKHGFGIYAAELKSKNAFIGFVGLNVPSFRAHFTPCVEIGWRLSPDVWGQGLATEAAEAVVKYGRDVLKLKEIVSFTVPLNVRSRRIMEKNGMSHDPADDFDHPQLPPGHPLRRHVLYRLRFDLPGQGGDHAGVHQHTF
jgi:RimJ/RimL family protein N-acetyltransferase